MNLYILLSNYFIEWFRVYILYRFNLALEWLSKKKIKLLEANEGDFIGYFTFLRSKNYKANSLTRKLSSISRFYKTLKDENYIINNPLNNLDTYKKDKKLPNALYEGQILDLIFTKQ